MRYMSYLKLMQEHNSQSLEEVTNDYDDKSREIFSFYANQGQGMLKRALSLDSRKGVLLEFPTKINTPLKNHSVIHPFVIKKDFIEVRGVKIEGYQVYKLNSSGTPIIYSGELFKTRLKAKKYIKEKCNKY